MSDRESLGEMNGKLDQVLERLDEMGRTVVSIEGTLKVDIDLATKPLGETHVGVGDSVNYPVLDGLRGGPFFGTVAWVGVDSDGTVNAGVQVEGSGMGPVEVPASTLTRVVA